MIRLSRCAFLLAALLLATPAFAQVDFGGTVTIAGDDVLIGEPGNFFSPGFVYVYRDAAGVWQEVNELSASDASDADGFGASLAVDGDSLAVGATASGRGSVYLFRRADGDWVEIGKLSADDLGASDQFGAAVAMAADLMVVGAPRHGDDWGAVYVYRRSGDEWTLAEKLTPDMPAITAEADEVDDARRERMAQVAGEGDSEEEAPEGGRFGSTVGIFGDWVLVGAPFEVSRAGLVYVYRQGEEGLEEVTRLGEGGSEGDRLGSALAYHAGTKELYIGAPGADGGRVDVFRANDEGDQFELGSSLRAFDGGARAAFGSAIAFSGDRVLISAPYADGYQGRVYSFARGARGLWAGVSKIGTDAMNGSGFGGALAAEGDVMVAGISGDDWGAGTAMIMSRTVGGWDRTKVVSTVRALDPITGARANCTDGFVGPFSCEDVDLISYLPLPAVGGPRGAITNDIWGWTDPETARDYALVGITDRTSFVDVTDPYDPVYVGQLVMTEGARGSVWRDIKVHADHAFIVSDSAGDHGIQIFDLTRLREYKGSPITFTEDAHYDQIASAHNIVINEASAFAFVVGASGGGETCGGGLHMVNIEDPRNPIFAGCFADTRTGSRGTGYSHDAQCVTYEGPDDRYVGREICIGSNETAISIADVTDKRNPIAVGMASYPNVAYSHQGWLTEDQRFFYMNDEGDEASGLVDGTRTIIWDVQDLEDPIVAGEYIAEIPTMDHNLYVVGNVMYQSNYEAGLRVFDIADPENPRPIGYFDTVPYDDGGVGGGGGSWSNYPYFASGLVVVTSMYEGLFVVKLREGAAPASNPDAE